MTVAVGALSIVVALLTVLVAGLLRGHAEVLRALHEAGQGIGETDGTAGRAVSLGERRMVVPGRSAEGAIGSVAGHTPAGDPVAVALSGRQPTLVAFLTSSCLTCRGFWEAFAGRRAGLPPATRLVIVTKSAEDEQPAAVARLAPDDVVTVMSSETWATLGVPVAPFFIHFGSGGEVLGEGAAASWEQLIKLLRESLADEEVSRDDRILRDAGIDFGHTSLRPGAADGA